MLGPLLPEYSSQTTLPQSNETAVVQLNAKDDHAHLPKWKRLLYGLSPIFAIATLATYWIYFVLRIKFVRDAQRMQHAIYPMAWIFIAVEIMIAIPTLLHNFWSVFVWKKRRRPQLRLLGMDVPTVDVLITCCKEDVDLIIDTVRAACEVDYPTDKFRVVVLDDGASQDLREAITMMSDQQYHNLHYRCREKFKGVPHHFKAGNLNYGIRETGLMPGGPGQLIAALDADMIPESCWLRAIVPHLLLDPKMAMACPPQAFYNIPKGDPLNQNLDFFVHVSEPIKDVLGVAWCTGSGYVVRRDMLEEIGCFPQGSLAEDVATSTLLLGKGWKTAFIHEPLQFGTVPDSFGSHLKQRTRWVCFALLFSCIPTKLTST
jgi:cellulose synthase/poly-beta-1,6-N-acetylglucosamine synthase-like glycosyltransferase